MMLKEKLESCDIKELQNILEAIIYCIENVLYSWATQGPYGCDTIETWYLNVEAELHNRRIKSFNTGGSNKWTSH